MSGWAEASGPAEPDAGIREEIDRIERAILQGAIQILEEFGCLQAALKRSVALEKQARRQAGRGGDSPRCRLANGAPRGSALLVTTGARLMAALECANDAGGRCALWPSGDARRCCGVSRDTATSCAFAAGSVSAARAALTGTGATPQSEGLVRVRGQVCLRTCPRPPGVAPEPSILPGRVLDR